MVTMAEKLLDEYNLCENNEQRRSVMGKAEDICANMVCDFNIYTYDYYFYDGSILFINSLEVARAAGTAGVKN